MYVQAVVHTACTYSLITIITIIIHYFGLHVVSLATSLDLSRMAEVVTAIPHAFQRRLQNFWPKLSLWDNRKL